MKVFFSYIKKHIAILIAFVMVVVVFWVIFSLYNLETEAVIYSAVISTFVIMLVGCIRFIGYYKYHKSLTMLEKNANITIENLPKPHTLIEEDYQDIIRKIHLSKTQLSNDKDISYNNMVDYYTLWVHQIKTPIAAMRILLQSLETDGKDKSIDIYAKEELLEQLFKIEQYVEMVLQYLRMESNVNDLDIRTVSVDDAIKQAIKKYAKMFIRKKITLNYQELNQNVITDEKWIVFVIEQILSNSLKYTGSGGEISIYCKEDNNNILIIEDTGIGIKKEDTYRVFEKGFTGYNGHEDKKSTGIGLYLCKKIIDMLSHKIYVESEVGKGTKIIIDFTSYNLEIGE